MEILSSVVLGVATFAIFFTFLAIFMNRRKKVKPKTKHDAKKALIVKYPLMFVYVMMLIFAMIVVDQEDEQIEAKGIDNIVNQIRSILAVRDAKLKLSINLMDVVVSVLRETMSTFYNANFWTVGKCGTLHIEMVLNGMKNLNLGYETHWIGNCRGETNVTMNELHHLLNKLEYLHGTIRESALIIHGGKFSDSLENCYAEMNKQSVNNLGIKARKQHLNALEDMIRHYEKELEKTEFKREEWYEKTKEFSPKFNTQLIVKLLVSATTMSIYFLFPISIFAASHHTFLGSRSFTKAVSISLHLNGMLTISISIIAILLSTGIIGRFDCLSEVKKLGLWRLTSPFPYQDKYLSICSRPNTTFYSELSKVKLPDPDDIMKEYDFEIIKNKLQNTSSSIFTIKISNEYNETFEKAQNVSGLLETYIARGCLNEDHMTDLEWTKETLRNHTEYKECISMFHANTKEIFDDSKFLLFREEAKKAFIANEKQFLFEIDQFLDFSCDGIIDLYGNIGGAVCQQFDVPLNVYWIYVIVTIIVCMLDSVLLIFLYRSYASVVDDVNYPDSTIKSKLK